MNVIKRKRTMIKVKLTDQLASLDPVKLLQEIRLAQHALANPSTKSTLAASESNSSITIAEFIQSLSAAWQAGEVRPTHKSNSMAERWWRTRADPFESVWPMIENWLCTDSAVSAKDIMQRLCELESESFSGNKQLRTLQRRIKK